MRRSQRLEKSFVSYVNLDGSDEDDEDGLFLLNQPSTSTSQPNSPLSQDAITALVRAMLFRDQSKEPFTKGEIVKLALKSTQMDNRLWDEAAKRLLDVFGFVVKPLQRPYLNLFILVKEKPSERFPSEEQPSEEDTLLLFALGMIFMSLGSLEEDSLMSAFLDLGVPVDARIPLTGGRTVSFDNLVKSVWKKQMYLEIKLRPGRDRVKLVEWGPRAHAEVSKPHILNFMAKMMDSKSEEWREQYRMAHGEDIDRFIFLGLDSPPRESGNPVASTSQIANQPVIVTLGDSDCQDSSGDGIEVVFERSRPRATDNARRKASNKSRPKRSRVR